MSLASRLQRIEGQRAPVFTIVSVSGGMPGEAQHARARMPSGKRHRFDRHATESLRSFEARATAEAKALGADLLTIGGLR